MALQIAPIRSSRRQILPSLNVSMYERRVDTVGRIYYTSKTRIKSERRKAVDVGGKERQALENKALAKRTARMRQGKAIPPNELATWVNRPRTETGDALKKGIIGMAKASGITDSELFRKLNAMDSYRLQEMYDKDTLIFDVAFTYDEYGGFGDKESDLAYLTEVYESIYGAI